MHGCDLLGGRLMLGEEPPEALTRQHELMKIDAERGVPFDLRARLAM